MAPRRFRNASPEEPESDDDGLPGGRSSSKEYDQRFRVQETDHTKPREFAKEMAFDARESAAEQLHRAQDVSATRIHIWPNVGRFIIPAHNGKNSFAAHLQLVKADNTNTLAFNTEKYPYFDKIIAEVANRPDLFDPSHRMYEANASLRNNLAVLRNDIMGIYMDDGSFDAGDEKFIPLLQNIAKDIGRGLEERKSWYTSLASIRLDEDLLRIEGEGAVYLYDHLLQRQRGGQGLFAEAMDDLMALAGMENRRWNLPPASETPFTFQGLRVPAGNDVLALSEGAVEKLYEECRTKWQDYEKCRAEARGGRAHVVE